MNQIELLACLLIVSIAVASGVINYLLSRIKSQQRQLDTLAASIAVETMRHDRQQEWLECLTCTTLSELPEHVDETYIAELEEAVRRAVTNVN